MGELRRTPKRNLDYMVEDLRRNGYAYMRILYLFGASPHANETKRGTKKSKLKKYAYRVNYNRMRLIYRVCLRYGALTRPW